MKSHQAYETHPIGPIKEALREFSNKHRLGGGNGIAAALDIPLGTIDTILYSSKATVIKGSTKALIEDRMRKYDPAVCPVRLIKKDDLQRVLTEFKAEYSLNQQQLADVIGYPVTTVKTWLSNSRRRDFHARDVRKVLVGIREYKIQRAQEIGKAEASLR